MVKWSTCSLAIGCVLMMTSPAICQIGKVFTSIQTTGEKTVSAVATPVEKAVVSTTLQNCNIVKSILGVSARQLIGSSEPDVTKLSVALWEGVKKTLFNITEATPKILTSTTVNKDLPTTIFLHGFLSDSESDAVVEVTNALLNRGDTNVLALDSGKLISYFYLKASTCVRAIGTEFGRILAELSDGGVDSSKLHIVGHSLGAHIAGFAGKSYTKHTGKTIARITGLDPAGPCFFKEEPELRLKSTDADFVDVIHSDAGVFGIIEPLGHVDFYPNSGEAQPGCAIPPCSHSRAWQLYAESLRVADAFQAVKCENWSKFKNGECANGLREFMGKGCDTSARGVYFLRTSGKTPFGLKEKGIATKEKSTLGSIVPKVTNVFG